MTIADSAVTRLTNARNNSQLIAQAAQLGHLKKRYVTVDATWGSGNFWNDWRPDTLIGWDLDPSKSPGLVEGSVNLREVFSFHGVLLRPDMSVDATALPIGDGELDQLILDPPYQLNGTSTGRGPSAKDASYGVDGAYVAWQDRHGLICRMISEAGRVVRRKGTLALKCMDQVCSGRMRFQTIEFPEAAERYGFRLVDMLHLPSQTKQPRASQKHSRANYSTLLLFKKADGSWRRQEDPMVMK